MYFTVKIGMLIMYEVDYIPIFVLDFFSNFQMLISKKKSKKGYR
jgi:hypothetical protein